MLSDDLEVVDGAVAGAWIEPGLGGDFGAVSLQVPAVFEAYARVFHRAYDEGREPVTWAEVARRLGSTAHPAMQWHQLVGSSDTFAQDGTLWEGAKPELGEMEPEELDRLCRILGEYTTDPEHCFFGVGQINNSHYLCTLSPEDRAKPELRLPFGRDHVVFAGPLSAVTQLGTTERKGTIGFAVAIGPDGERAEPPEPDPTDPRFRTAPNLIWPAYRSWLVASEVDFDTTLVGGSRALIDALVAAPDLEVQEVEPDTSLAAFSDDLNPVPRRNDD